MTHPHFIYGKGEGKEGCLRKDFLFMMVSILPVSLSRRNNQGIIKSCLNIFSPKREINFCFRLFGKLHMVYLLLVDYQYYTL